MPSLATPMGTVPETKQAVEKNVSADIEQEQVVEVKAKEPEVELDEKDLSDLKEGQKIPYSRFKEKNDEAKALKEQIAKTQEKYEDQIKQLMLSNEALKSRPTEDHIFDLDSDSDKQVRVLKSEIGELKNLVNNLVTKTSETNLRTQLKEFKETYPDLDETAVLGWKKARPDLDLGELAELSHRKVNEQAEKKVQQLLEAKKAKAKMATPSKPFSFKINPDEKPKSVKEASKLLKKMFSS